ncbi:hypothetical protein [Steroidobacter cummioxidans]|uniref:hypothetical protein n=1 Tax=Steroidobacter cummioxidans TaxID=1803913 RepID=UPI00128FDD92|nr:hypothetical protein [Steroidobacter cummioxidans]
MRRTVCCAMRSVALLLLAGCSRTELPKDPLEARAQQFVTLALQLGMHDRKEVDAYFGPAELDSRNDSKPPSREMLRISALKLLRDDERNPPPPDQADRARALEEQLRYFEALLQMLTAETRMPFDEEAKRVYGIDAGAYDEEASLAPERVKQLDALLPGSGPVPFRVAKYRNQFVVPADKREKIFARAMEECRKRTLAHWQLPQDERLEVQFTRDVGAAWHKYEGGHRSTLKVNPVAIAYLGQMIDVACHEGYPGHHAQFLIMESDAGPAGLPVELTVALMRSPANVLREGAANYGVDLAFPPEERLAFERDVLFPMAGFPVAEAERHAEVHRHVTELALSVMPILREYRDGVISFNTATFRLEREAFIASPAALLKFVDDLGAYSTGYTVARSAVRDHVESVARAGEDPWVVLRQVVAGPQTSVLREKAPASVGDLSETRSVGLQRRTAP